MKKRFIKLLTVLAVAAGSLVAVEAAGMVAASAIAPCAGTHGNYFDAYESTTLNSPARFNLNVDSTNIDNSIFDPATEWSGDSTQTVLSGETNYTTSNMPGVSGPRSTNFSNVTWSPANNGVFENVCGTLAVGYSYNNNPSKWGQGILSCNQVEIYTAVAQ